MNLPNRLTLLRILLVPFFVLFLSLEPSLLFRALALLVFAAASLTDLLDGKIARARGLVTTFGKLMDPLADKILVMSAMICLIRLEMAPPVVVIAILAREFLVTSLRLVAAGEGTVIAADRFGKIKTVAQMCWIVAALLELVLQADPALCAGAAAAALAWLRQGLMILSLLFTLLSGFNYCWKNRSLYLRDM